MLLKSYSLDYDRDPNTGEYGFTFGLQLDYPTVATDGILVAHDIVEHVNGLDNIGTIADELQALSGVWLTRASNGDLRRDGIGSMVAPDDSVWADVLNMGGMVHSGQSSLVMRRKPKKDPYLSVDWCEHLMSDIDQLRDHVESETGDRPSRKWCSKYLDTVAYHLIKGETAYHKKFKKLTHKYGYYSPNTLFWSIAEGVDLALPYEPYHGIDIEIKGCDARVSIREDY